VIGLDTTILVRLFVRDDAALAEHAERVIRQRCSPEAPGFINHIVLCELAWMLEHVYGYRREVIASLLDALCRATDFRVQEVEIVRQAIGVFQTGRADFADCLIGVVNRAAECTVTLTFDPDAAPLDLFEKVAGIEQS
jgi:predicted nucleic-acid-binding protein